MDTPLFYVALFVHLISLVVGFGSVLVTDVFGLLWLDRKLTGSRVAKVTQVTERLIWLGWTGLVLSGLVLIGLKGYIDNLTMLKLFFVGLVGANGIYLYYIKGLIEGASSFASIPFRSKLRIVLGSSISQLGWWGAILIGFLHRHWRHYIEGPAGVEVIMAIILITSVGLGLAIELLPLRRKA